VDLRQVGGFAGAVVGAFSMTGGMLQISLQARNLAKTPTTPCRRGEVSLQPLPDIRTA
jgi:hypothetical protein